ncbi:MAG: hypothetical protein ACRDA3_00010 [Peptostreptococcaceae bacterium]
MNTKSSKKILRKEDLKDTLKKCSCCEEVLFASVTNEKENQFGAFKNQSGWYYQAWCKECFREKAKIYTNSNNKAKTEYVLEQIRLKRELERAEREWSVYKITLDMNKFDSRVKEIYSKIHNKYYYVGITKQEAHNRWNEHLYSLRTKTHSNYFLQCLYTKIKELYEEMSEDEFFNFFKSDIIKFEVIEKLDKNYTKEQAKISEAFAVKRIEHNIKVNNGKKYLQVLRNNKDYKQEQLILSCDEMITNIEHCNSTIRYKKELENKKNNSSVGSTQVTI